MSHGNPTLGNTTIPVTDRNRKLLALIQGWGPDDIDGGHRQVLEEAARELAKWPETATVYFPSEHYLNPAKLPLPPADFESLLMRIESKEKYVNELLDQVKPGVTEIQGHYEPVTREQMRVRVAAAIQDLFLHQRYARLHLAAVTHG